MKAGLLMPSAIGAVCSGAKKGSPMLTREQIEVFLGDLPHTGICPELIGPAELILLCQMALNSIPRKYDPEDKLLPKGRYVVRVFFPETETDDWLARWSDGKEEIWPTSERSYMTHYMPIPEVGE